MSSKEAQTIWETHQNLDLGEALQSTADMNARMLCSEHQCGNRRCTTVTQCNLDGTDHLDSIKYQLSKNNPKDFRFTRVCCSADYSPAQSCFPKYHPPVCDPEQKADPKENGLMTAVTKANDALTALETRSESNCSSEQSRNEASIAPVKKKTLAGVVNKAREAMIEDTLKRTQEVKDRVVNVKPEGLIQAGFLGLGEAARITYEDFKREGDLKKLSTYNPFPHFAKFANLAVRTTAHHMVGHVAEILTTSPEEIRKIPLSQLLGQARATLTLNKDDFTEDQRKHFIQLIEEADKQLQLYQEKQRREGKSGESGASTLTISSISKMIEDTARMYVPTLVDLEKEPFLRESFNKLETALSYPIEKKRLDPIEVGKDCQSAFEMRTPELRDKLNGLAMGIALASTDHHAKRDFHYFYGEPGNGKTTSVELLAKCTGVPLCSIEIGKLIEEKSKSMPVSPSQVAPSLGSSDHVLSFVDMLIREIAQCYQNKFIDTQTKIPVSNGVILLDDIDRALKFIEASTSNDGSSNTSTLQRLKFFELIKKLADPAQATLVDPVTKYPIRIADTTFFMTGNSIPAEMKKGDSALMSRIRKYPVPYPTEEDRKKLVEFTWLKLQTEDIKKIGDFHLNEKRCKPLLERILKYDLIKHKESGKRFGIRGLERLLQDFSRHVMTLKDPRSGKLEITGCDGFNVEEAGLSISDYSTPLSEALLEEDFEREVRQYQQATQDQFDAIPSKNVRDFVQEKYRYALEEDLSQGASSKPPVARKLKDRRTAFEDAKTAVKFAIDRKDFSGGKELYKKEFLDRFTYLKVSSPSQYRELRTIANEVGQKLAKPVATPNKLVLLDKEDDFGDIGVVRTLSDLYGVPVCEIRDKNQIFKSVEPRWKNYVTPLIDSNSYIRQGALYFEYDKVNKLYILKQSAGEVAVIHPKTKLIEYFKPTDFEAAAETHGVWVDHCLKNWRDQRYPGQGFVLISVNDVNDLEYADLVRAIYDQINVVENSKKENLNKDRDLSQLTVILNPENSKNNQFIFNGPERDKVLKLTLSTLSLDARAGVAEGMLKDALENLSRNLGDTVTLTSDEKKFFGAMVRWDRSLAERLNGKLSLTPMRTAIDNFLKDVEQRYRDYLGFGDNDQTVLDVIKNMQKVYAQHLLANGKATVFGQRIEEQKSLIDDVEKAYQKLKSSRKRDLNPDVLRRSRKPSKEYEDVVTSQEKSVSTTQKTVDSKVKSHELEFNNKDHPEFQTKFQKMDAQALAAAWQAQKLIEDQILELDKKYQTLKLRSDELEKKIIENQIEAEPLEKKYKQEKQDLFELKARLLEVQSSHSEHFDNNNDPSYRKVGDDWPAELKEAQNKYNQQVMLVGASNARLGASLEQKDQLEKSQVEVDREMTQNRDQKQNLENSLPKADRIVHIIQEVLDIDRNLEKLNRETDLKEIKSLKQKRLNLQEKIKKLQ
jgi:hypothetical protein